MPVSDFLSVHCFASVRSRSAFFSKPECCADVPLRNLIPRLNKPRFAFAAAKSAWLCVERGVREVAAAGLVELHLPPGRESASHQQQNWPQPLSLPPARIFVRGDRSCLRSPCLSVLNWRQVGEVG